MNKTIAAARKQLTQDNKLYGKSMVPVPRPWPLQIGVTVVGVWRSRDYLAQLVRENVSGQVRLSVQRTMIDAHNQWLDGITWDELQRVKREVGLDDFLAVEVYPRDRDVVHVANMRHLFILDEHVKIGWRDESDTPTTTKHAALRLASILVLLLAGRIAAQNPAITKRAFDNANTGVQTHETALTQASVAARGLVLQTRVPVLGDARGMEAQPLILPGVKLADGTTHDVMVLPSMANVVRGVDAATGAGLWQTTLGTPVTSTAKIDFHQINQHFGCLSTGVLDPDTARLYQVCWISTDGTGSAASGRYFLFVLRVADGGLVVPPVPVQTGAQANQMWKQRSSLVMTDLAGVKTVFFAHGSVYETSSGYTGGITAFDVATNTVSAQLPLSAGIWMAGASLAADPQGRLYAVTGNGDFDPANGWYGESFVRVTYTPAAAGKGAAGNAATLLVAPNDVWSPWTDWQRTGQASPTPAAAIPSSMPAGKPMLGKLSGMSAPSEAAKADTAKPVGGGMGMALADAKLVATRDDQGRPMVLAYPNPTMALGAWSDEDWGSAAPACNFALGVCVAAGKDGIGYPIDTRTLGTAAGSTALADVLRDPKANCAKLAAAPVWLTVSPGPVDPCPADARTLNFFPWGDTAHLHMTPVQLYDPVLKSWTLFVWGENGTLHKWAMGSGPGDTGALRYIAESHEYASADVRGRPPGGMAGGACSASTSGVESAGYEGSALLFCAIPYGDANATITQGRLLVYDPFHLTADGSLKVLWDSQRWGIAFTASKFLAPTVWNSRIYLPDYSGSVMMFSL